MKTVCHRDTGKMMEDSILVNAEKFNLNANLIRAIIQVESFGNPWAVRFEPKWSYFLTPEVYAKRYGITIQTEATCQQTSWGLMQVMGSVARELGYKGLLTQLLDPELGIQFGCMKLFELSKKYHNLNNVIASYNAGSPKIDSLTGKYLNQEYVSKVREIYDNLNV